MNVLQRLRIGLLWAVLTLGMAPVALAQVCECLNCPVALQPAGLDTCYYREFILNIRGAANDDLSDPFQGVCAVDVHFQHNYVWSQEMWLISPAGDTLALTGPAMTSGYASSALSSWNIRFIPNKNPPNPDTGFNGVWSNDQLWEVFRKYTGQYHPAEGSLEDFDSGPVNGQWRIRVKNCTEIESGNFINFSIVFCDETGLDCSCQAYAGSLLPGELMRFCQGDPALNLDLEPFYLATPPASGTYGYTYILAFEDIIQSYSDTIDLRTAPPGTYEVCGLSYDWAHQDSLLLPDGILTIPLLKDTLYSGNPPFCGDISTPCLKIQISEPLPLQVVDTTLCAGQCYTLGETTYCQSVIVRDTFVSFGGCDSIVELRLTVLAPVTVYRKDTICAQDFVIVGTNFYNKTGIYTNLLNNPQTGCDSLVVLDLLVLDFDAKASVSGVLGCANPVVTLNGALSQLNAGNPQIRWEAGPGGNIVAGQQGLLAQVDQPGAYALILSQALANGKVCADTALVQVQADLTRPDLQGPAILDFCSGATLPLSQLPVKDASQMGGSTRFYWSLPFIPANQINQSLQPLDQDSVFVHYQVGSCRDTFLLKLREVTAPYGQLLPQVTICNEDGGGLYNTWINFDTLLLSANVLGAWSNVDMAPVSGGFPLVNFANVPGPKSYTFRWTSVNAPDPCPNIVRNIEVFVENCGCPSVATLPPGPFCQTDADALLAPLQITLQPGQWSLEAPPGLTDPALLRNDSLIVQGRDTGWYKLIFTLEQPPPPGCPDTSTHWFTIQSPRYAQLVERDTVCNDPGSGTFPMTRILRELIVSGDETGQWQDVAFSGAQLMGDTAAFFGVEPGQYTFTYTTGSALGACPELVYAVEITVLSCVCPPLDLVLADTLCQDAGDVLLNGYVLMGGSGVWSIVDTPPGSQPAALEGGATLRADRSDPGDYLLRYTLNDTPGGLCRSADTLALYLQEGLWADVLPGDTVCNVDGVPWFPAELNLMNLVQAGDTTGVWIDLSASGAGGSLPLLEWADVLPGTYSFAYVLSPAVSPCADKNYKVEIEVRDCQCPQPEERLVCNDQPALPLDTVLSHGPVTWTILQAPVGTNPAAVVGMALQTQGRDPGGYTLMGRWQPPPNSACPDSVLLQVELVAAPQLTLRPLTRVCNMDSPFGPRMLWLDSLALAGAGGQWLDLDDSGAGGTLPLLDFTGVAAGDYRFIYQVEATAPCLPRQDTLLVRVSDCSCPPLVLPERLPGCTTSEAIVLGTYSAGLEAGVWILEATPPGQQPAGLKGDSLWVSGADTGVYLLVYQLDSVPPGCPDTVHLRFDLSAPVRAGTFAEALTLCAWTPVEQSLPALLTNADPGGLWALPVNNPALLTGLNPSSGQWSSSGIELAGQYGIQYITPSRGGCPADTARLELVVLAAWPAAAGPDVSIPCTGGPTLLGDASAPTGPPWEYRWYRQGMLQGDMAQLGVEKPGLYILEVRHQLHGCPTRDSVWVQWEDEGPLALQLALSAPTCDGRPGTIEVLEVIGGSAPHLYRLDMGPWQPLGRFEGLTGGMYVLELEDDMGCRLDTLVVLPDVSGFSLDLGPDRVVAKGSNVLVEAQIAGNSGTLVEVRWDPLGIVCPDCLEQLLLVQQTLNLVVTARNADGCTAVGRVTLFVSDQSAPVFVPNAISVNEDGINDGFTVFGGAALAGIAQMAIFDRWGNRLFYKESFAPNQPALGWDGRWQGRALDPSVYVYQALLTFADGTSRWIKGEVQLLR